MDLNVTYRGFTLDPFQIQAISEIENGHSLVLSAPTGSGKTLVAEYLIEKILQTDQRIIYTSPIKALSNQKYRDFSRLYGDKIGILTGDVVINREAQALIMTTEVYRNMAVEDIAAIEDVAYVIFDEIHFLGDIERGTVWEESIIFSPKTVRFLALSATIPNCEELARWIESVSDHKVSVISHDQRSVPLSYLFHHNKVLMPFKELFRKVTRKIDDDEDDKPMRRRRKPEGEWRHFDIIKSLQNQNRLPLLYFAFSRALVDKMSRETAERFDFTSAAEKKIIVETADACIEKYRLENLESASQLRETLIRGVGRHHAGLLPQLKELVEVLFAQRLLKVLFVTETFAVGVNMPARSVAYDSLKKFDGRSFRPMSSLEFQQISGRAGRRGIDEIGWVIVPHLPRDLTLKELEILVYGDVQPLLSQFDLSFNSVLNLYAGHKNEEIRMILKKNFAQFQANRDLPKLTERVAQFRTELEDAMPRCTEKANDIEAFMAYHKRRQEIINSMNRQLYNTSPGMRGRRNRPHLERLTRELNEKYEALNQEELTFICGRCKGRKRCAHQFHQAAKIQKKLDYWRTLFEQQEELQLPLYEKKVQIMRNLGYIDAQGLLPRGEFCSKIHTEEVAVTELFFKGVFHEFDPHEINALALSLVYEPRRRGPEGQQTRRERVPARVREARVFVNDLSKKYNFIKPLETGLAPAIYDWSRGGSFEELVSRFDITEGDLIRCFRQAIDLLRQIREAADDKSFREKLATCLDYINRDIILATELRD